jgi:hypothetical protein
LTLFLHLRNDPDGLRDATRGTCPPGSKLAPGRHPGRRRLDADLTRDPL